MKRTLSLILAVLLLAALITGCTSAEAKEISFTFVVVGPDGTETEHALTTTKKVLSDALLEAKLISADEHGGTGLYTVIDGITAEWSNNEAWWQICKDGESLSFGMDDIKLTDGDHYEAVYTEGME